MVIYFDTNVFRDLAEKRVPKAEQKINSLIELKDREITIAPSFEVLHELLSAPDIDNTTRIKNAQFYLSMVDWTYALKPSNQILSDDIFSLVNVGGPSTPYNAIDSERSGFIQDIKNGQNILPDAEWVKVVAKSRQQNEHFVTALFTDFVRKLPKDGKTKLRNSPDKTWNEWWRPGALAEIIANTLVVAVVGDTIKKYSPLVLPTVRTAVGYILHTWYKQIITNAKVNPTAHYDFRNAVLAGGVGRILTGDKKLRNAIRHIHMCNIKVWILDEFLSNM